MVGEPLFTWCSLKIRIRIKRILISLLFGCALSLTSVTYSIRVPVIGAAIYRLGFPMYWLEVGRPVLPLIRSWGYAIVWEGLVGDIAFWTFLTFLLMILFAPTHALEDKEWEVRRQRKSERVSSVYSSAWYSCSSVDYDYYLFLAM